MSSELTTSLRGPRVREVTLVVAVALLQTAATIAVAKAIHGTIDAPNARNLAVAGIIALALGAYGLEVVQRRLCDGVGLAHAAAVRQGLFDHLLKVRPDIVRRRREGAMLQSFVGDLTSLRQWVSEGIMRTIVAAVTLAGLTTWALVEDRSLALAFVVTIVAAIASGSVVLRFLDGCVKAVRSSRGKVSALAAERLTVTPSIIAFGRRNSENKRMARRVEELNAVSLRRAWLTGLLRGLPHLASSLLLLYAVLSPSGLSLGGLAARVTLIGILGMALRDLARAGELWVSGRIARERMHGLMSLPTTAPAVRPKRQRRRKAETGLLVFDRLKLRGKLPALSASVARGSIVLVDGDPDMRQDLIGVIAALRPAKSGKIRWNGSDIATMSMARRRRTIGLCARDLPLLRGSVSMNLRYRASKASAAELAREAGDWGLALKDKDCASAPLELARAMIGNPPLLVLELADGALDDTSVERLRQRLSDYDGVVLLMTTRPELRILATENWLLGKDGLQIAEEQSGLAIVEASGRAFRAKGMSR